MAEQTARGKSYRTNVLESALGVSRGTLRYYEQLGLLQPHRAPGSNYRMYSNDDVFRVVECTMLKSAGCQVQQAREVLLDPSVDAESFVDSCLRWSEVKRKRAAAVVERFDELREVVAGTVRPTPRIVVAPEWLVYHDGAEGGYDRFEPSEVQDALLEGMPITSFAAVMHIDVERPDRLETRWGRVVPARHLDLFPELEATDREPVRYGGCPCLVMPYSADTDKIPGFDEDRSVCAAVREFLHAHGLRQAGPFFAADVLPVRGRVYTHLYLPVEPTGVKGRLEIALARLRRR